MTQLTTWLIGSYPNLPQQDFTINAVPVTIAAGSYYLFAPTGSLSLFDQLKSAMALAGLVGADVRFLQNRKIEIRANGNFSLTWPGDGLLRNLLGFTGDLPGGTNSYIAPLVSDYVWSGAKPMTWVGSPVEVLGRPAYDQQTSVTPDGTVTSTGHFALPTNSFSWRFVVVDRYQTDQAAGGEFVAFHDNVLRWGRNFLLWWKVTETDLDVPQVLPNPDAKGPYILDPKKRGGLVSPFWKRSRGFERLNRRQDIDFDVLAVRDYVN